MRAFCEPVALLSPSHLLNVCNAMQNNAMYACLYPCMFVPANVYAYMVVIGETILALVFVCHLPHAKRKTGLQGVLPH